MCSGSTKTSKVISIGETINLFRKTEQFSLCFYRFIAYGCKEWMQLNNSSFRMRKLVLWIQKKRKYIEKKITTSRKTNKIF